MDGGADRRDSEGTESSAAAQLGRSPIIKTRSMSDGGGTAPKLSPSPLILEASRRTSKDDIDISPFATPSTPTRPDVAGLSLHMQQRSRDFTPPPASASAYIKPAPLSPKLDQAQIYASPTNILPRRSRGLDFSRAATSLHHSTLAESSPESSPTVGGRGMNIPGRGTEYGGPENSSTSLWSIMGNQERLNISSSLGSTQAVVSDSSSSSDDDDHMDEDTEDAYVTTPQVSRVRSSAGAGGLGNPFGSPAMSSLASFQQRQRPRRHHQKKKRGPLGLGFNMAAASVSKSPPSNASRARRESISWQANQLNISGGDPEESGRSLSDADGQSGDGQPNVIRRAVTTRRGNLLPKTKTFARIRAALLEESAPAETEFRREAEVVKQVRESDVDREPRQASGSHDLSAAATALSSPNLTNHDSLEDMPEEDMMGDLSMGLSSSFKQQAFKNSKGKSFWDTFSECSSVGGARNSPPPPAFPPTFMPRGSSSGISEDAGMDSPSVGGQFSFPPSQNNGGSQLPTAAEITRRINTKRRRDDDLDPVSFKRRAVSPGLSAHNSPVIQSPMQKDNIPWGSRPGSNGGDKAGGSSAQSESGSMGGTSGNQSNSGGRVNGKGRVGFQGMVDTNDAIMRMSIE